jgi:hypothetical protein
LSTSSIAVLEAFRYIFLGRSLPQGIGAKRPLWIGRASWAYVTGTVDQELLARNEYLATENRTLVVQLPASF